MSDHDTAHEMGHEEDRMGVGSTTVACVFALVIGGVVGIVTTFGHAQLPPWGLVAGLAIVLALVVGFRLVFGSRVVGAAAAVGFLIGSVLLAFPAAGSPVFVVTGPTGWIWTIGPVALAVVALLPRWRRRAASRP